MIYSAGSREGTFKMPADTMERDAGLPARWHRDFVAAPAIVAEVRAGVTGFARQHGAPGEVVTDIALAVSEAATNAVLHAFVDLPPGRVSVVAEPGSDCLLVRVIDEGRGMMPRSDSPGLGLGLPTMAALASSCDIREAPGGRGTEVRLVFAAPGVRGPSRDDHMGGGRFELLAEVAHLAEGGGWPGEGVERLVDLLVPAVADACTLDLLDDEGAPHRLAARVSGDRSAELSDFLANRAQRADQVELTIDALRTGDIRIIDIDRDTLRTLASDDADAERMAAMELTHWLNLPLRVGDQLLGSLGLGLGSTRAEPEEQLAFLEALAERAARGLANSRLVGELQRVRRRLERILGALAEAVTVNDEQGRVVYANPAAASLLGADSVEEVLAAAPGELADRFVITNEDGSPVGEDEFPGGRLIRGLDAPPLLTRSVLKSTGAEYWLLTKATLLDDEGLLAVSIIEDVTEAKTAERRQRFLAEAGELLASTLDYEQALAHVARLVVPTIADWCAIDLEAPDGSLDRVALAHADPDKQRHGEQLRASYPPDLSEDDGLAAVLRGGDAQLWPDISDELLVQGARDPEHLALLRELGMRSAMIVPIRVGERTIGVLSLISAESRQAFDADDLAFAQDLARRGAVAVENARPADARS